LFRSLVSFPVRALYTSYRLKLMYANCFVGKLPSTTSVVRFARNIVGLHHVITLRIRVRRADNMKLSYTIRRLDFVVANTWNPLFLGPRYVCFLSTLSNTFSRKAPRLQSQRFLLSQLVNFAIIRFKTYILIVIIPRFPNNWIPLSTQLKS